VNAKRLAAVVTAAPALLILSALAACGGAPATTPARAPDAGADTGGGASSAPSDGYASLDALAARGPTEAPLMRELLRVERASPRSPDLRADKDLCLRALFAAERPVRAWFSDSTGASRGEIASGTSGSVPPRGPVCAAKGEALHLVVESSNGAAARAVIFAAP
jgi:hypothetical protein